MVRLALFDFCETLVNFQTADTFVDYVREKQDRTYLKIYNGILNWLIRIKVVSVLNKFFPGESLSKKLKLLQIRNIPYDGLDQLAASYYNDLIKPNLILPVVGELLKLSKEGYQTCLVSAGYSIYLKYFIREYKVHHLISTEISFDKYSKRCLGRIDGKDCIGAEKVKRINAYFEGTEINLNESTSFSDSITDLPMLLLTADAVVVSKTLTQAWSEHFKFRQIIWDKI